MSIGTSLGRTLDLDQMKVRLHAAQKAVASAQCVLDELNQALEWDVDRPVPMPASTAESPQGQDRLIPVVDWPKHHPWPKVSGLRHLIFNAEHNGFEQVLRRIGGRILIHEREFFEWVEQRNGRSAQSELPLPTRRSRARHGRKANSK